MNTIYQVPEDEFLDLSKAWNSTSLLGPDEGIPGTIDDGNKNSGSLVLMNGYKRNTELKLIENTIFLTEEASMKLLESSIGAHPEHTILQ